MQNTRLDTLPQLIVLTIDRWLQNPWRLLSLQIICGLLGYLLGITISTISGQEGFWDITMAVIMIGLIELINWWNYRPGKRSAIVGLVNTVKLGVTLSYILEAFKLAS